MRTLLFAACAALAGPVYAQYFTHHYGNTSNNRSQWGMYTPMTAPAPPVGYVISGISEGPSALTNQFMLSRADNNGASIFNHVYTLMDAAGMMMGAQDAKVTELPNNQGFGVAGTCIETGGTGQEHVFYVWIDRLGFPMIPVRYYQTPVNQRYRAHGIRLDPGPNYIYICGEASTSSTTNFFVMKIDINGNIVWGHTYVSPNGMNYINRAFDVLENPILPMNPVAVVGTSEDMGNTDAFLLSLDPNNGLPMPGVMNLFGTPSSYDHFYAIDNSVDPVPPPPFMPFGYVIGGYTNVSGNNDSWVVRVDDVLNFWSKQIDYTGWGVNDECRDVVEIKNNATGQFEYYAGGHTDPGLFGASDMILNKLDVNGTQLWQGTYGSSDYQYLSTIDENPMNNDIALFGETRPGPIGNFDLSIYNLDVNGKTACKYYIGYWPETDGPKLYDRREFIEKEKFYDQSGEIRYDRYRDIEQCRIAAGPVIVPKADANGQIEIYSTGGSVMTLEAQGFANAPGELMITDVTGRILYQDKVMLQEETTYLPVDLSALVSNGIYTITLRQGGITSTTRIVVAK